MESSAILSDDGVYRYHLRRTWSSLWAKERTVCWVMLNPSTADETVDDPTIRRCMGFAKRWGYGGIEVVNLFALRATNPAELSRHPDPIGPDNSDTIRRVLGFGDVGLVVVAWGAWLDAHPHIRPPRLNVEALHRRHRTDPMVCLGLTRSGAPRHPLYVPADATLREWAP